MGHDLRSLFQLGADILSSRIDRVTRKVLLQIGNVAGEVAEGDNVEQIQHNGFVSRPPNPEAGKKASQAFIIRRGDHDVSIAEQDLRGLELAGELGPGETCVYAAGADGKGQARLLLKGNGAIAMYALEGNEPGGASVTVQCLPSGEINIAGPFGGMQVKDGKLTIMSGSSAGVQLDANGVSLLGQTIIANGSVVLGDASATGVATQQSMLPLMVQLTTLCTTLQAFLNFPLIAGLSGGTAQAAAGPAATLGITAALPTNFSQVVKASG